MSLHLSRRHAQNGACRAGRKADSLTSEAEERNPKWKHCHCWIYAIGSAPGYPRFRRNTKRIDWKEAREVADRWERGEFGEAPEPEPINQEKPRTLVWYAIGRWYRKKKSKDLKPASLTKYRTLATQLYAFTEGRGLLFLDQITSLDADDFYASWKMGKSAKAKKLENLKGLFNFAKKRKFITGDSPAEDLEPPSGHSIPNQKTPFNEAQWDRVMVAAHNWKDQRWHNRDKSGVVTAFDVVTYLMMMVETGFGITDGSNFHMDSIEEETQECSIRRTKSGVKVNTWLTDELFARLHQLAEEKGPQPFLTQSRDPLQAGDAWRERLNKVFAAAGPFPFRPTPHILRHTFVRIHLQRPGTTVRDVAELTGDTEEMIRKHYAQWVPERQERLSNVIKQGYIESQKAKWRKQVKPQVIEMPKKKRPA